MAIQKLKALQRLGSLSESQAPHLLSTRPSTGTTDSLQGQGISIVVLTRYQGWQKAWSLLQLARGSGRWGSTPGLSFVKVLGSGFEGGFGIRPSWDRQGLFLVFDQVTNAEHFLSADPGFTQIRQRSVETLIATLEPFSMRGRWSGQSLPSEGTRPGKGEPIVAITRASIRLASARRFWSRAPESQHSLENAEGCWLAAGLGEAPLLRQMTFSIWETEHHMALFARQGAHQAAIAAARAESYFSESMFARYRLLGLQGSFNGKRWNYRAEPRLRTREP